MHEGNETIDRELAVFLVEDYKLKADYLKAQFDRLWRRFQIFLAIESALFAFFFRFLLTDDGARLRPHAGLFAALGVISAVIGLLFGAQDRYLVNSYRQSVKEAGTQLRCFYSGKFQRAGWAKEYATVGETHVDNIEKGHRPFQYRALLEWHTEFASITMLPALFAIAIASLWLITLRVFA